MESSLGCTIGRPCSSLKTTLLGNIITTSSRGQKVLASPVSVDEIVGSSTDRVKGDTVDHSINSTQ
jgi:hypothetical protein